MKASKIHEILRNKQKVDIFYNERPVWIQEVNNDIAKIGFIDNFEEKNVHIEAVSYTHLTLPTIA